MFANRATTPGTGKGLIVDSISLLSTGRVAARMSAPGDDSEARKRITAIALEALPIVLIDNVEGSFGSPCIAAALTADIWSDRVLGESRTVTLPIRAVWFLTGNNVTFRGDLGRRVIPCDLDARCEHPEDRAGFEYPNLREHISTIRPRLVAAALTILRAYHVAGRPSHGKPAKGSFEAWDALVRGALIWAGAPDPVKTCERVRQEADLELDALREAVESWETAFGRQAATSAEATQRAKDDNELAAALAALAGCPIGKLDARRLGYGLRRFAGRIVGGRRFEREVGRTHGAARWLVRKDSLGGDGSDG